MHTQDFKGDTDFLYVGNQDVAKKAPTRNYPKDVSRLKSASGLSPLQSITQQWEAGGSRV